MRSSAAGSNTFSGRYRPPAITLEDDRELGKLEPKPNTVALLYADDAFDVAVADGTRPLVTKSGFTLAMDVRYSSNASISIRCCRN